MSAPRTFKPMNIEAFKKAVETVAHEDNVPSLSFPAAKSVADAGPPGTDAAPRADTTGRRARTRKPSPAAMVRVAVDLPVYLTDAIRKKAAEANVTKRFIYLQAFRAAGFAIQDVDMMEDGRRDH